MLQCPFSIWVNDGVEKKWMKMHLFVLNLLFIPPLSVLCVGRHEGLRFPGRFLTKEEAERILSRGSSKTGQISNWGGPLQKPNKGNTPQEPCGRRVRGVCYLHVSSPNTFSTDIQWTFPSLPAELFLRRSTCYEPQLHWLQQAVQLQCQALCGHPTSLGSAHTELTDCPWTKRMKYSWVTPLCGGFPV